MGGRGGSSGIRGSGYTDSEVQSIRAYTNTFYETINNWLRLDRDWQSNSSLASHINNIDSAIRKSSINEETTVYRGVSLESLGVKDVSELDGKVITEKGFMSTSTSERTARSFVNKLRYQEDTPGVVVRMNIPKSRGLAMNVGNMSAQGGYENEILVSRGNAVGYSYKNGVLTGTIIRSKR